MTQRRISKRVSILVVAGVLLLAGGAFAAATGNGAEALYDLARGKPFALERHLSRGSVALAVDVGTASAEGEPSPAEGAVVTVVRSAPPTDHPLSDRTHRPLAGGHEPTDIPAAGSVVATGTTDAEGRVVLELRRGPYEIVVEYGAMSGTQRLPLHSDTRVGVVFDESGNAHFFVKDRRDMARHGDAAGLAVRVGEKASEDARPTPVANATVRLVGADGATVAENLTGPRGFVAFYLHAGHYTLQVETEDGRTGETPVDLHGRAGVNVVFDADGTAHFLQMEPPHDGPADGARHPTDGETRRHASDGERHHE